MISLKTKDEIVLMREAGRIVALAHQEVSKHIAPGVSTKQLDKIVEETILKHGATPSFKGYGGFPASICASINDVLIHGIPDHRTLKEGDIISIDIGANYKGYHGDSAWTYAVGKVSDDVKRLMKITEEALYLGLKEVKPGNRITDISNAIQKYAEANGYSIPRDYTGHGIGKDLHEDPIVPNFGEPGRGPVLKVGMAIAIEPMVNMGVKETKTLMDGWTVKTLDSKLSAHYEHTVIITENGYEITTQLAQN